MLIYTPHISPRLSYILEIIFQRLLHVDYRITDQKELFSAYQEAKLSYGDEKLGEIHFFAHPLLWEEDIHKQEMATVKWNSLALFFPIAESPFPFDPFAVAFYLISRYEEYLPNEPDLHGRFCVTSSVAWRQGFHRKPVIHIIAKELGKIIRQHYPEFEYTLPPFSILNTYDIDIAYQYQGKNVFRFIGSFLQAVINGDVDKRKKLYNNLLGRVTTDEFDTFDRHRKMAEESGLRPVHFILTAPLGKFDRNIHYRTRAFHRLIKQLKTFSDIGIHPSYHTSENRKLIKREITRLEKISNLKITKSRQHFLRFSMPGTFETLSQNGIGDDYSMGWHDEVGFRASVAIPFPFYNLLQEKTLALNIHPLIIMDGALAKIASTIEEQEQIVREITEELNANGGELTLLRHNSFKDSILN